MNNNFNPVWWYVCKPHLKLSFSGREPDPENLPGIELTVPLHATNDSSLCRTSHVILYQSGGKREPVIKYKMEHVKTLPVSWFTQSILRHQLIEPALFVQ